MKPIYNIIAVLLIVLSTPASSQEKTDCLPIALPGIQMLGNFSGQCKKAIYLGQDRTSSCADRATMITYLNGRAGFSFRLNPNVDIVLTGGKDAQPATKTMYQLERQCPVAC